MMVPGDEKVVAQRLHDVLSKPPKVDELPAPPQGNPVSIAGQWQLDMEFDRGTATHTLVFEQNAGDLVGSHQGEFISGDLTGKIFANQVHFRSSQKIEGQRLFYDFTGTVEGDKMTGNVGLGEYGSARWSALRHQYQTPVGVVRPVKRS
jgi:L-seryl-tRNA(Ser) seleniumtransferase